MLKGKDKENSLRRLLVGVFAVSLFVAFMIGRFAIRTGGITGVVNIESNNIMFTDGTIAKLEAHALFPVAHVIGGPHPGDVVEGKVTVIYPSGPIHPPEPVTPEPCMATFTNGMITQTVQEDGPIITSAWLFGTYPTSPACSAKGLSGAFSLWADTTGSISLKNSDNAAIALGMGNVVINNPPMTTSTGT